MKQRILIIAFLIAGFTVFAQEKIKNYSITGYLQSMEMIWKAKNISTWQSMNTITNRFDFRWYPNDNIRTHIGMRNIISSGQMVTDYYPMMHNIALIDQGKLDLTAMIFQEKSIFMYTNLDRANIEFTAGKLVITAGRQRVNWGINLVWNPNDIFNAYNYFDFDYTERPGSDAVRLQYYTGMTSSLELVCKINQNNDLTYAALFKFNKWEYDFQFLGGILNEEDYVFGLGWAGQIEGAGFMGEATYFKPIHNYANEKEILVASITLNYTFKNSLLVQIATLYNSSGTNENAGAETVLLVNREMSAKNFTLAKHSLFGQLSYPITPLIRADISGIFNPGDKSSYIGPSIDISLSENINFNFTSQVFLGSTASEFGDYGSMFFGRLKYTF